MSKFKFNIEDAIFSAGQNEPFAFSLVQGQHWFIAEDYNNEGSYLLDWIESKKNFGQGAISLSIDETEAEGHYSVSKYIKVIRFKLSDNESEKCYYQQRYHATENNDVIKLKDFFGELESDFLNLIKDFDLYDRLDESVNMLSSGEFRKACIIKGVLQKPYILFLEEPYIGIDKEGKQQIDELFKRLTQETSIVIVSKQLRIPAFITHVLSFDRSIVFRGERSCFVPHNELNFKEISFSFPDSDQQDYTEAIKLKDVMIQYDGSVILKNINWTVKKNEKWALMGRNGAGKSTLLSLIYADHPQVYSNDVFVFGRKRGTGESIWEVKENIGFYSSEFFRYFNKTLTVEESIALLMFQNPYVRRSYSESELRMKNEILEYFDLGKKKERKLYEISSVEQRLVIICGAILKNAPLLILDEPFQGFDPLLVRKALILIEEFAKDRTMVFVSHNPEEIPGCVTQRIVLENGIERIEKISDKVSLFSNCNQLVAHSHDFS